MDLLIPDLRQSLIANARARAEATRRGWRITLGSGRCRTWRRRARMVRSLPLTAHNRILPNRRLWVDSSHAPSAQLQCRWL